MHIEKQITQGIKGKIKEYKGPSLVGKLDFSNADVIESVKNSMERFVDAPSPHFISTFVYFYCQAEQQENPITATIFGEAMDIHPGQGRYIASFLRGDTGIDCIFVSYHDELTELDVVKDRCFTIKKNKTPLFFYNSQNHIGISTEHFKDYYLPTDKRLDYEKKKQELLDNLLQNFYPIKFEFDYRSNVFCGGNDNFKTVVKCKNACGLFESVKQMITGITVESKNFKI